MYRKKQCPYFFPSFLGPKKHHRAQESFKVTVLDVDIKAMNSLGSEFGSMETPPKVSQIRAVVVLSYDWDTIFHSISLNITNGA